MDNPNPEVPGGGNPPNPSDVANLDPALELTPPTEKETDEQTMSRLRKNPAMTEVGKANLIKTIKSQINSIIKRLNRQLGVTSPMLQSKDFSKILNETSILDRIHSELTQTHARFCEILNGDEDDVEFNAVNTKIDEAEAGYFDMKTQLCTWQLQYEDEVKQMIAQDEDSSSKKTSSSKTSKSSKHTHKSKDSKASSSSKTSTASSKN